MTKNAPLEEPPASGLRDDPEHLPRLIRPAVDFVARIRATPLVQRPIKVFEIVGAAADLRKT